MKKVLKIFSISLASLLFLIVVVIVIALWFVLTPEKLTPIVRKQLPQYINCQSEISNVELTFFRTFPHFGLRADQLTLINPQKGAPNDTLIHVKELIGIINISSLIKKNELIVNDFRLTNGSVCAYIDSIGNSNFDIFNASASEPDTTKAGLTFKLIDIENVDLKNMNVLYVDEMNHLKADVRRLTAKVNGTMNALDNFVCVVDAKPFDISLEYNLPDASASLRTEISNLSTKIIASLKSKTANLSANINPFDFTLFYHSDSLNFDTDIRNFSATISASTDFDKFSGNIRLDPFKTTFCLDDEKYLQDAHIGLNIDADAVLSRQLIQLNKASVSLNDLKLDFFGTIENDTVQKTIATDLSFKFNSWSVKNIMALIPNTFASYLKGIEASGNLSSEGTITGNYSKSSMPLMDIRVLFENGIVRYDGFPLPLNAIQADLNIHTDLKDPQSYVRINRFAARTPKSSIKTTGTVTKLFSDIHADLNTDADVVFSEFMPMIPDSLKITASGKLAGKVKTEFSMSQISKMQLEKIKASGTLNFTDLDLVYDSLSLKTDHSTVEFSLPNHKASSKTTQFLSANISANTLKAYKINTFNASLINAKISAESSDFRDTLRIPNVLCAFKMDAITAEMDSGHVSIDHPAGNISVVPRKEVLSQPKINLSYNSNFIQAEFGQYSALIENIGFEIVAENDPSQKDLMMQWSPQGFIDIDNGRLKMSALTYPVEIPGIFLKIDPETVIFERGTAKIDHSDFNLSGKLTNISSYIRGDSLLRGVFSFTSETTDILQILNITSGIGYTDEEKEMIDNTSSSVFMVPKGVDMTLHANINQASYGKDVSITDITGEIRIRNGLLVLDKLKLTTPAADMQLTAMYQTPRKNHLFVGLDLHMFDIEIEELLQMIPEIDSIMPMLRSFGGKGEFHFAAETNLDSMYNVKMSTIRGASSIRGTDLILMDGQTFSEIAKTLRFNKKTENRVDSLSAEFTIFRDEVDVYPFLIVMDKYKAVVGGRHNLDMTFDYNISVVQSPLPVRMAVEVKGTPDKLKYKVAKSKYPDFYRPASRKVVENKQLELRQLIRNALTGTRKEEE